jgi:hypothetical protein
MNAGAIIAGLVLAYLIYKSQKSGYRSATLSAYGAFPTRSKLLLS